VKPGIDAAVKWRHSLRSQQTLQVIKGAATHVAQDKIKSAQPITWNVADIFFALLFLERDSRVEVVEDFDGG
jgi:hypothetical protein